MRSARLLGRLSATGPSAQVAVAGSYAWAVTVAPVAAYHGAPIAAKVAAGFALAALFAGRAADRWRRGSARFASLAGFTGGSTLVWLLAPAALRPVNIDSLRGLAGMLGWALFAFASAGPALGERFEPERIIDAASLEARQRLGRADAIYLVGGTMFALLLQCGGWEVADPERALLVRIVALATGLSVIGASTEIALARHAPRDEKTGARARLRHALAALAVLTVLALSGLLLAARD